MESSKLINHSTNVCQRCLCSTDGISLMPTKPLDYLVKEVKIKLPQTNPKKEKRTTKKGSQ
jgi:hypothetical protein